MIWTILITLIGFILIRFITSLNKDNDDLQDKSLSDKFSVIVSALNDQAFNGNGDITTVDKRTFNLYQEGQNQIVSFEYSTGHLTIIWRYKYFQKELIHERQFKNVRNLSLFEQGKIAETVIKEMDEKIEHHNNLILKDAPETITNKQVKIIQDYYREKNSDEDHRKISITSLAETLGCMPWEVKDNYKTQLSKDNFSKSELEETIKQWSAKKIEEAAFFEINLNNTPAAILEEWTIEFKNENF